jgi:hypothetical protein
LAAALSVKRIGSGIGVWMFSATALIKENSYGRGRAIGKATDKGMLLQTAKNRPKAVFLQG